MHLIQIGDHQQLPPKVETHALQTEHLFGTSQLERLISLRYPHVTLCRQGRMLASMLPLLSPIYPDLGTNIAAIRSAGLEPLPHVASEVLVSSRKINVSQSNNHCPAQRHSPAMAITISRFWRTCIMWVSRRLPRSSVSCSTRCRQRNARECRSLSVVHHPS